MWCHLRSACLFWSLRPAGSDYWTTGESRNMKKFSFSFLRCMMLQFLPGSTWQYSLTLFSDGSSDKWQLRLQPVLFTLAAIDHHGAVVYVLLNGCCHLGSQWVKNGSGWRMTLWAEPESRYVTYLLALLKQAPVICSPKAIYLQFFIGWAHFSFKWREDKVHFGNKYCKLSDAHQIRDDVIVSVFIVNR